MVKRKHIDWDSDNVAYIIYNKTDKDLTLIDFLKENQYYFRSYKTDVFFKDDFDYTLDGLILSCINNGYNYKIPANLSEEFVFNNRGHGGSISHVMEVAFCNDGESKNFEWATTHDGSSYM